MVFLAFMRDVLRRRRKARDKEKVIYEYTKKWRTKHQSLESCETLEDWLYVHTRHPDVWRRNGKLGTGRDLKPYLVFLKPIEDAIVKYFPHARSITEYGCGSGLNLLYLKEALPSLECYGYELTHEGANLARSAAEKFALNVEFRQFDYVQYKPVDNLFPPTDLALTVLSLEQIPRKHLTALQNIHKNTLLASIHIEPIIEQAPLTPWGLLARIYHRKRDYLQGFMRSVKRHGTTPLVNQRLNDTPSPLTFPSLLILPVNHESSRLPG
jgi:hypothetical protein